MDLSQNAKERIEALSPKAKISCCKTLKEGSYKSVKLQFKITPMFLIEIFETMDITEIPDMSKFLRAATSEFIKANKKTNNL